MDYHGPTATQGVWSLPHLARGFNVGMKVLEVLEMLRQEP